MMIHIILIHIIRIGDHIEDPVSPRFIILGLLGIEPMSGYDIKKWVDMSFRYFWEIGYGQIYPTLRRLEEEGLVTMKIDHEQGGPEKKIYTISDSGVEVLQEMAVLTGAEGA